MSLSHGFFELLPVPTSVEVGTGLLRLTGDSTLGWDPEFAGSGRAGRAMLSAATGLPLPADSDEPTINFRLDTTLGSGAYRWIITETSAMATASDQQGMHNALQTLRQLLGPNAFRRAPVGKCWQLPTGTIHDTPGFGWRGVLLDVARHFLPKSDVLRFIDVIAAHKLNVLNLHLTDDQGWRMQILRHPRLTEVGSWRSHSMAGARQHENFDDVPHGGFYTQDDLREIVAYAADRGITVVPEIEVPGHLQAAIAATPELGPSGQRQPVWPRWGVNPVVLRPSQESMTVLREILDEVMDVFDSPIISIGGDEVPTGQWHADPESVRFASAVGLTSVDDLHAWVIGELAAHLHANGRRVNVWDDVASAPLPAGSVVAAWRSATAGDAARARGLDIVLCQERWLYLDYRQSKHPDEPIPVGSLLTLADVYHYRPLDDIPAGGPAEHPGRILGVQAQIWTEHLNGMRRIDYAAFPRLAAFAEAAWNPRGAVDFEEFTKRLERSHLPRLDAMGVEYRPSAGPHPWQRIPGLAGFAREPLEIQEQ